MEGPRGKVASRNEEMAGAQGRKKIAMALLGDRERTRETVISE